MQKKLWEREYLELKNLPSSKTPKPARALTWFIEEYCPANKVPAGRALDVGMGRGRNSVYLAQKGWSVTGTEIADAAISLAKKTFNEADVASKVQVLQRSAGEKLPLPDVNFNLILDMMVLHLLSSSERDIYAPEVMRLLKPGGHFLFYTIYADSPAARNLCQSSPGPEPNSYVIPQSGMIEKGFTESEIKQMFHPLRVVNLETKTEFTPAFGDIYERVYLQGLLKK